MINKKTITALIVSVVVLSVALWIFVQNINFVLHKFGFALFLWGPIVIAATIAVLTFFFLWLIDFTKKP